MTALEAPSWGCVLLGPEYYPSEPRRAFAVAGHKQARELRWTVDGRFGGKCYQENNGANSGSNETPHRPDTEGFHIQPRRITERSGFNAR
ncbi:MAG: hypothetical protein JWM56_150 [Candidatus Peribacteria bacterium]|nr:hypothetical protein [Candidatus Peribacteria bacterium]